MHARLRHFVSVFLAVVAVNYAADPNATNSASLSGAVSNRVEPVGVEEGFRKALGSIKARVDLMDPKAEFRISRTGEGRWLIQLNDITGLPAGGLSILVGDNGPAEVKPTIAGAEAGGWLGSGVASAPDPTVKIRPEVAFRQGIQALTKWWGVKPDCFLSVEGRTILSRAGKEEWHMALYKYSVTGHPEWRVTIKDNAQVEAHPYPALGL